MPSLLYVLRTLARGQVNTAWEPSKPENVLTTSPSILSLSASHSCFKELRMSRKRERNVRIPNLDTMHVSDQCHASAA